MLSVNQLVFIYLPVLLVSVSVHETMHALASYLLGDDTAASGGRISLNPLRHIDPYLSVALPLLSIAWLHQIFAIAKPVQVNFNRLRWDEFGGAIVGAAGPASNLIIALVGAGFYHLVRPSSGSLSDHLLVAIVSLNVALMVINLIPWPPLDGSRILFAFAPCFLQELMITIESSGIVTLLIFLLLFYQGLGNGVWNLISAVSGHLGVQLPVL